ncbi:hypothetical protein TVAG_363490 [Trichomonas vaginalis G3]|uniref:MatE family protein n=1 Tax=Trichomonas vaginalis (strain ATCC PRA-98 / G3) TaxID=412133 RepID=A2G3A3_TRIV3|nr:hypothetical protein TVAG_116450 [Trichomonas vaginalis G3]EAX88356.1 hypothetical protein TVAG_363490 [Trichomonas vaginalis G3]|eukprot:XP_001300180.1 hypothetical protein [Trichomonas vaginalis G3]
MSEKVESTSSNDTPEVVKNNKSEDSDEELSVSVKITKDKTWRLGGRPPLKTITSLAIGPVISQIINAAYGIITTFYISLAVGEEGLSAISTYAVFDSMGRSFGFFLTTAASAEISALFGQNKDNEVHQLSADIFRLSLLFGIVIPAILVPNLKAAARWFGASEPIVELGYKYIGPLSSCAFFSVMYIAETGLLIAEGRTGLSSILLIAALGLNMCFFGPIFLFAAKIGMLGAGLATILSESITGITFAVLFFCGKFTSKPTLKMLISKPSPYLGIAMKIGLSQLLAQLSAIIPAIIVRKIIGNACLNMAEPAYNEVMSGYICSFRYQALVIAIFTGITQAQIPATSFAYQKHENSRILWLTFHAVWLSVVWGLFATIVSWAIPRPLAKLFGKSDKFLKYASEAISIINGMSVAMFGKFIGQAFLQAIQWAYTSIIISLFNNLVTIILFAFILYYTDKSNPIRIMWCYSITYGIGIVLLAAVDAFPLYKIWKNSKPEANDQVDSSDNKNENEEENDEMHVMEEL